MTSFQDLPSMSTEQRDYQQSRRMQHLECIAIPMTSMEVNALPILFFIWRLYGLMNYEDAEAARKPCLVITLPNGKNSIHEKIYRLFSIYELGSLFSDVRVIDLQISPEEDIYIRDARDYDRTIPRLGLKSGPNKQFFQTMRICSEFSCTLLNEVDMLPLTTDWLDKLANVIPPNNDFMVLGSRYSGEAKLGPDIARHINGNAIYNTGNPAFQEFLDTVWEPGVEEMCKDQPDTAYDIWFSRHYYQCMNSAFRSLSPYAYTRLHEYDQKFIATHVIANVLPTDQSWYNHLGYHISNGVTLLHGKTAAALSLQLAFTELESCKSWIAERTIYSMPMSSRLFLSLGHAHSDSRVVYHLKRHFCKVRSEPQLVLSRPNSITAIMESQHQLKVVQALIESNSYANASIASSLDLQEVDHTPANNLFAFSPYKSGSTLLFNGLQLLCSPSFTGMNYKSYYDESFKLYGDTTTWLARIPQDDLFAASGCIYGGFRDADPFTSTDREPTKVDIIAKSKSLSGGSKFIFLFRDPRDCLVSLYYSHLKSHRITNDVSLMNTARMQAASMTVNRYVLNNLASTFENFVRMLTLISLLKQCRIPYQVFTYEYIFYHQFDMFRNICASLNYDLDDVRWQNLVDESQVSANPLNVYPVSEDESKHIRKGAPGDYKSKLSETTVRLITKPLYPLLEFLQRANPDYSYFD